MSAVVGIPDPIRTESIKAWIVCVPALRRDALAREIQEFVKVQLAAHEYPRFVQFVETLPMTATGRCCGGSCERWGRFCHHCRAKAPTGPRKARPDDRLRASSREMTPAIHVLRKTLVKMMDTRVKPAYGRPNMLNRHRQIDPDQRAASHGLHQSQNQLEGESMTSISGKIDPVVRRITAADIAEALGQGLRDFQPRALYGLAFGALYAERS